MILQPKQLCLADRGLQIEKSGPRAWFETLSWRAERPVSVAATKH